MRAEAVPDLIRAAGDDAVKAYRSYFETGSRRNTRRNYAYLAGRFFRWVAARGLTLEAIDARTLAEYGDRITAERSRHVAGVYLTPVRGVLRHLAVTGVLGENPCALPISDPQTPEQWQEAVDAAWAALALDSLVQFGLLEPLGDGFCVNADRCRDILERGGAIGITPAQEAQDAR
jgi:hypothetical protein